MKYRWIIVDEIGSVTGTNSLDIVEICKEDSDLTIVDCLEGKQTCYDETFDVEDEATKIGDMGDNLP